jgi:hypothetical protein
MQISRAPRASRPVAGHNYPTLEVKAFSGVPYWSTTILSPLAIAKPENWSGVAYTPARNLARDCMLYVSADHQLTISAHSVAVENEKSFNNQFGELMTTVTLPTMLCSLLDSHNNSRPGSHVNHCDYNPAIANSGLAESNTEPRPETFKMPPLIFNHLQLLPPSSCESQARTSV